LTKETRERFPLRLSPELEKKLNDYVLKVANKKGKVPYGIYQKIGEKALNDWLDKHGDDLDILFKKEKKKKT
jgi:hypothetical protein